MGSGQAYVGSSDLTMHDDIHVYAGTQESSYRGNKTTVAGDPVWQVHTLGRPTPPNHGVLNGVTGYDSTRVASVKDLYAQPVMFPMIQRDYGGRTSNDPWDLRFKFRFTAGGESFDNGTAQGARANERISDSLRYQVAMGSAVVYYHRKNTREYSEPPNLFNPFWRATLVSGHIFADAAREVGSRTPAGSVGQVLRGGGHADAAKVADALDALNYRGY
jgi:hypothetical protein